MGALPNDPSGSFTIWWMEQGSNPRHLPCKRSALPTELSIQSIVRPFRGSSVLHTTPLSGRGARSRTRSSRRWRTSVHTVRPAPSRTWRRSSRRGRGRTFDLLCIRQTLSPLSYTPLEYGRRIELLTEGLQPSPLPLGYPYMIDDDGLHGPHHYPFPTTPRSRTKAARFRLSLLGEHRRWCI